MSSPGKPGRFKVPGVQRGDAAQMAVSPATTNREDRTAHQGSAQRSGCLGPRRIAGWERPERRDFVPCWKAWPMIRLLSLDAILSEPIPPVEWVVEPLIGIGNRVVVYGEWGSYKSWGLLDLALRIAAGRA